MKLYNYYRSSASFRVRIALNLKGLPYEYAVVHLTKDGGQQFVPAFRALNPDALIPVLDDDGRVLTQSLAIIEYLDETHPEPPLLPRDALERAYVRSFALGDRLRDPSAQQPAGAALPGAGTRSERGREESTGTGTGSSWASPRSRPALWPRGALGAMCWASASRWQTSC